MCVFLSVCFMRINPFWGLVFKAEGKSTILLFPYFLTPPFATSSWSRCCACLISSQSGPKWVYRTHHEIDPFFHRFVPPKTGSDPQKLGGCVCSFQNPFQHLSQETYRQKKPTQNKHAGGFSQEAFCSLPFMVTQAPAPHISK